MSAAGDSEVTDVMIAVSSLPDAVSFWVEAMGLEVGTRGDGWVTVVDARTGQRLTLVEGDIGADYAVAVRVGDVSARAAELRASPHASAVEVGEPGPAHCLVTGLHGSVMLYAEGGD